MSESDSRAQFEKWISDTPHYMDPKILRVSGEPHYLTLHILSGSSQWDGQYNDINVQRSWEAWQASERRYQSCVAVSTMDSVCHVFRTAEDFRQWITAHRDSQSGSFAWVDGVQLHE